MDEQILKTGEDEYPSFPSDPEVLPDSTFWPALLAFGLLLFFWGLITSLIISGAGFICIITAITGWIFELNYEE